MSHTYEIRQREAGEHRPGHMTLLIDGVESEYTNDPAQAMPSMLKEALKQGKTGEAAAKLAAKLAEDRSRKVLERVVERIKSGSRLPGGVPMTAGGLLDTTKINKPKRTEEEAIQDFLNRGRLKGLDAKQRKERAARRNERRDHEAEWHDRRAKLIAQREGELKELLNKKEAWDRDHKGELSESKLQRQITALMVELNALKAPVLAASHGFQYAYGQYLTKQVDLVNDDIRIVPCMTNTTVDTERDAKDAVSDFTTLDEFDGSGYSTGGQALDTQAVNIDDANDRAEFDAADEVATLGAGTRSIQGNLLISFITNLNSSLPLHWLEYASNKTPDGSQFTVQFNAEGILQAADG